MRALLLVLLAACGRVGFEPLDGGGPGDDGSVLPTSGSRLKLKWFDFAGARQIAGIRDTQLGKDCVPLPTVDGTRCVPIRSLGIVGYADAGCTQPIGLQPDNSCPSPNPEYFLEVASDPCTIGISRVLARGATLGPGDVYAKGEGSSCIGPATVQTRVSLGAELPFADMASLSITAPVGSDRLRVSYLESSDGFRMPFGLYDAMLDTNCMPLVSGGRTVCAPEDTMRALYSDAACQVPIGITDDRCPPSRFIEREVGQCFREELAWFERGPSLASVPTKYSYAGDTCVMTTTSDADAYALGVELTVIELDRTPAAMGGRVRAYAGGGASRFFDGLYDSTLGIECLPEETATGAICVPTSTRSEAYFSDAACNEPIDLVDVDPDCTSPVPRFASTEDECGNTISVQEVGAMFGGTVYTETSGCTVIGTTDVRYEVGSSVSLPTGTITIDP